MKKFFSVIIPTLNEEKFLPKLLDCLLKQEAGNFEVIIADGESEDKTIEVCQIYEKKFKQRKIDFQVFQSGRNNVSYQRNFGVKRAEGKYLVFFDADVQIPVNYLLEMEKYIKKTRTPFLTTWVEADSKEPQDKIIAVFCNLLLEASHLIEVNFIPGFNIVIKKNIFDKIKGFEERVAYAEDYHLGKKLKKKGFLLAILKEPRLTFSLRRFRREGRLKVLREFVQSSLLVLLKGPIAKEFFDYPMGGHLYNEVLPPSQKEDRKEFKIKLKMWREKLKKNLKEVEQMLNQI